MKNLITAAIIAMTATSAQAGMDRADEKVAASCVHEYYDGRSDVELTASGKRRIDLAAQIYNLSNIYSHLDVDWAQEKAEHYRQEARDEVKKDFGKHAGEINYCFRQHMGG
ncbi:hypothetical protein OAA76_04450 [Planktotalea frisia]|nr:hypothetical protein [Planktotalea frisia]